MRGIRTNSSENQLELETQLEVLYLILRGYAPLCSYLSEFDRVMVTSGDSNTRWECGYLISDIQECHHTNREVGEERHICLNSMLQVSGQTAPNSG